jgi:glucose-fructose oxidoreductase
VTAFRAKSEERRFQKSEEMVSVVLRFPKDRLANFTCSFGIASVGRYTVSGTKGMLTLDPAYDYAADKRMRVTTEGNTNEFSR